MPGIADKIPDWVVYLGVYIVIIVPMVYPLGLPVPIGKYHRQTFDVIEALPEGSTVMIGSRMGTWNPGVYPGMISVCEHVFRQNVKVIFVARVTGALNQIDNIVEKCPSAANLVYGEDWITLYPSIKLEDAPNAALGNSIPDTCPTDFRNQRPITEYPIMEGISDASSLDLLIDEGETDLEATIRQLSTPYDLPTILIMGGADHIPFGASKIEAGLITSALMANPGFAAYETMINQPGDAVKITDSFNIAMSYAMILLLIGNVSYFQGRGKKET
jgi:hypothetical protein